LPKIPPRNTFNSRRAGRVSGEVQVTSTPTDVSYENIMTGPASGSSTQGQAAQSAARQPNSSQSARYRMPRPGEKNAPTFDPEKPEELGRFFERLEDWFEEDGIVDDAEKKRRIVKYLDADSEYQWKALPTFEGATWEEFKAQVMSSYPAAEEVTKGSVAALKRKIKKIGPVAPDERDELLTLVRNMTAEVVKLKKITPPIHTNRELVELFLDRLTPDFANRVAGKLSMHRLVNEKAREGDQDRNPEDMYDIEQVMEITRHTSLEHANPFGKYITSYSGAGSTTQVKLEEAVARLTDTLNLQTSHNRQIEQRLTNLQNSVSYRGTNASHSANVGTVVRSQGNGMTSPYDMDCFYCKGPHRMNDCENVHRHLELGWIIRIDGKLRLATGAQLPRDPVKTTMILVEAIYANKRAGLIPMSKIQEKDAVKGTIFAQLASEQSNDYEGFQTIVQLAQSLGIGQVQRFLEDQVQKRNEEDKAEWEQNFE
jgi:hypothetical protein